MTILQLLTNRFTQSIASAFPGCDVVAEVTPSTNDNFGDYQCNSSMKLAKQVSMDPRKVAQLLLAHVDLEYEGQDMCISSEIKGPGFINLTLNPKFVASELNQLYLNVKESSSLKEKKRKIIVEYSSPNIAKEMHVGHLRSTIIGDCLARLFEFLGHDVLRLNHVGDWGTQFGMLIHYIKEKHPHLITGKERASLPELMQWYKASKVLFDEDPLFKKNSQLEVVNLQAGDAQNLQIWEKICQISREGYQEIYDLLDINLIERGESFYNPKLPEIIKDLDSKGLIELSDGAKCVFVDAYKSREGTPQPLIVQKSDGGYTYGTTDLAALRHRVREEKANQILYVVDSGQALHFNLVLDVAKRAGYFDPYKTTIDHVPFGLVLGADGKKFRTRSGETEKLIDLLLAAVVKADEILKEKNPEMSESTRKDLAHHLGLAAVKYADLSVHRTSDYQFSYDKMLRFEGNTAAFVMYAYVRVQGIKKQLSDDVLKEALDPKSDPITLETPQEIALAKKLIQFKEALSTAAKELAPNRLTDYIYSLAETFNAFFRDCKVVGDTRQTPRLKLCDITARVLETGLNLLGIKPVNKM